MAAQTFMQERSCRGCGCTWTNACPGGCWWIETDLCSSCRHLRDRKMLRRPRRFWWCRHVDLEMGFVRWSPRFVFNGRIYGHDLVLSIEMIRHDGREMVAKELRRIRFSLRLLRLDLQRNAEGGRK